jgi:hypothetical protein
LPWPVLPWMAIHYIWTYQGSCPTSRGVLVHRITTPSDHNTNKSCIAPLYFSYRSPLTNRYLVRICEDERSQQRQKDTGVGDPYNQPVASNSGKTRSFGGPHISINPSPATTERHGCSSTTHQPAAIVFPLVRANQAKQPKPKKNRRDKTKEKGKKEKKKKKSQ